MDEHLKDTIAGACEVTGVAATLLLVPLAAADGLDGLDFFAMALAVLPLLAALVIRGSQGAWQDREVERREPPLRPPPA
jgi:hypothetical protein